MFKRWPFAIERGHSGGIKNFLFKLETSIAPTTTVRCVSVPRRKYVDREWSTIRVLFDPWKVESCKSASTTYRRQKARWKRNFPVLYSVGRRRVYTMKNL